MKSQNPYQSNLPLALNNFSVKNQLSHEAKPIQCLNPQRYIGTMMDFNADWFLASEIKRPQII
jgi:hypothetical protein